MILSLRSTLAALALTGLATQLAACSSEAWPRDAERLFGASSGPLTVALPSCSTALGSGYDGQTRKLTLTLDAASTNQIIVAAVSGALRVNGFTCVTASGAALKTSDVDRLEVVGTSSDDLVILDLSSGPFAAAMTAGNGAASRTGFKIDLGTGSGDSFTVKGSAAADTVVFGASGASEFVDITGDGRADVVVSNTEELSALGGDGNDRLSGQAKTPSAGAAMIATASVAGVAIDSAAMAPTSRSLSLIGGAGDDTLVGGNGDDTLDGGDGNDTFVASGTTSSDGDDRFIGGAGVDTVDYSARSVNIYASIGASRTATMAAATSATPRGCAGKPGDDGFFDANGQQECDDIGTTVENVTGGSSTDVLIGSSESNTLRGGDGDDFLWGGPGNAACSTTVDVDVLEGGNGNDVFMPLVTGAAATTADCRDRFIGGAGTDFVLYAFRSAPVVAEPNGVASSGESGEGDTIDRDVEVIFGGAGNDTLTAGTAGTALFGCRGDDTLTGGSGSDVFFGGPGNDVMNGGPGDDRFVEKGTVTAIAPANLAPIAFASALLGCSPAAAETTIENGAGADKMNGGSGVEDTADYGGDGTALVVTLGPYALTSSLGRTGTLVITLCASTSLSSAAASTVTCTSGTQGGDGENGENDDVVNVSRVYGGSGNDTITGTAGNDMLYGYAGNDTLNGGAGSDTLVGGATGNSESNVIIGGNDDDICLAKGSGAGASYASCELTD